MGPPSRLAPDALSPRTLEAANAEAQPDCPPAGDEQTAEILAPRSAMPVPESPPEADGTELNDWGDCKGK